MNSKNGPTDAQEQKNARIERLHRKFDPAEKFPVDPDDASPKRSQKQPGQEPRDPQTDDENPE